MTKDQPLVSVLMTSYNSEKYIKEAITSILNQSYRNWELLIADDCSTDSTRDVIASFNDSRIKVFHNESNLHYLRTRNKLIGHVLGDLVTLLDSDDTSESNRLESQTNMFISDPDLGMCGTLVNYMSEKGEPLEKDDNKPLTYDEIRREISSKNVFTGSTIMVKTEILKEIGGYRDYFNTIGYEDYDLTSRIVESHKAINIGKKLYNYRQYPDSTSKRNLLYNPFKLHGHLLVQEFINQRKRLGEDALDRNDIPFIIQFILSKHMPYVKDSSLIYRNLMWSSLNRGFLGKAFTSIVKAISLKPISIVNWKTLILFFLAVFGLIKK